MKTKTMEEGEEARLRRPPRRPGGEPVAAAAWISEEELRQELKPERVQLWLEFWPQWQLGASGKAVQRTRWFPTDAVATMYAAFVTAFAAARSLPVGVNVAGGEVKVILYTRQCAGRVHPLTGAVLDLASHLA